MEGTLSKFSTPEQTIHLSRISDEGIILDIGAGGEGIVARLEGNRVCAADVRLDEIREARIHDPPANWFVTDGRNLCFADSVFDVITFWFSLGYFRTAENKLKALTEAFRVLRNGGKLMVTAAHNDCKEEIFIFRALFIFPDGTPSKVGYGVRGGQNQTADTTVELIKDAGFSVQTIDSHEHWFSVVAVK